jgi:hypothetical protein
MEKYTNMNRIDLQQVQHSVKIGDVCPYVEPNVTEDSIFFLDGKPIGFYIKKLPEKASKLADLANAEFRSKNVPKSIMNRTSGEQGTTEKIQQFSTILGSVAPRPHMRRPYGSISNVHTIKSAQIFIKSMIMLAKESEQIIADILPEQYKRQVEIFRDIPEKWRFANLFTSSISNYNISAPYHRDTGNLEGTVNVIICKKFNSKGGDLNVPDFGATIGQEDNSMLVYPVWQNIHGVTPITPTHEGGYRNSLVFYPLKAFKGLE